jgi:S-adenosylmethionine:diacylglycerol 3-amino-3-carboxypropyl transferase
LNHITWEGPKNISLVVEGKEPVLAIPVLRLFTYRKSNVFMTASYGKRWVDSKSADSQAGSCAGIRSKDYIVRIKMYDVLLMMTSLTL